MEAESSSTLRSGSSFKIDMGKDKDKSPDAKFKVILKECNRIQDRVNDACEKKEIALLEILKSKIVDLEKSLDEEFFALSEVGVEDQIYESYVEQKDKVVLLLLRINTVVAENSKSLTPAAAITPISQQGLKLPKFELSVYSGKPNEWLNYKELFTSSIIQNKQLSDIERLQYLNSSLKGTALQLIKGFSICDANFSHAWQTLVDRFDNKHEIANAQINKLFNLKSVKAGSAKSLHELLDACNEALRNLKNLGYEINSLVDLIFVNILQSKLDDNLRQLYQLSLSKNEDPNYDKFIQFLDKHARSLHVIRDTNFKADVNKQNQKPKTLTNSAVIPNKSQSCCLCSQAHLLCKCEKFLKLPNEQKWSLVKTNQLCFNCLRGNHRVQQCLFNTQCKHCQAKHHSSLHRFPPANSNATNSNNSNSTANISNKGCHNKITKPKERVIEQTEDCSNDLKPESSLKCFSSTNPKSNSNILLSTAMVKIKSQDGKIKSYRALVDNGSQKSLISKQCCEELGLTLKKSSRTICGINDLIAETSFYEVDFQFAAHFNTKWMPLNALVVSRVTADLPNFTVNKGNWPHLDHFMLADPNYLQTRPVDLLLGADLYADLITGCPVPGSNGSPAAINSKLGFLLCGRVSSETENYQPIVTCHAQISLSQELQKFWILESVPQTPLLSAEDQQCEEIFASTVSRDESGRYTVSLPFRPDMELGDTRSSALKRFLSLEKRLNSNHILKKDYNEFLQEYLVLGHMMKINEPHENQPECFLPHHGVVKEDSSTTRLRVVFDASMKSTSGKSLNECMYTGPKLQTDLLKTLIRFRSFPVALSADIEKMYRQIQVIPEHCDYQKIFWRFSNQDPISEYKLLSVTYGLSCAPYLAIRTLHQLARDEKLNFPAASDIVLHHFYVDDLLTGADSIADAQDIIHELNSLMKSGGFNLRKWTSNCPESLNNLPEALRSNTPCVHIDEDKGLKVLGILWNSENDTLQINFVPQNKVNSKRQLLSVIAKIFDPMGILSPSTVLLKILLQDLWRDQLGWDDPLPPSILQTWCKFSAEIEFFPKIKVPRCLQSTLVKAIDYQLYGFSDASSRAYAAVTYLKTVLETGDTEVKIIAAKTRVAPVKSITLPRLELCGTLLLAKLSFAVVGILPLKISKIKLFSDSEIVLHWLKAEPVKLSTFVSHRVAQIQNLTSDAQWYHVRSSDNPADVASRGIMPQTLLHDGLWWSGPSWIKDTDSVHETSNLLELSDSDQESFQREVKSKPPSFNVTQINDSRDLFSRFSSFSRLYRVIAYCLRFIHNSSHTQEKLFGHLSAAEITKAISVIVKLIQIEAFSLEIKLFREAKELPSNSPYLALSPFLDSDGILRVGGRLKLSDLHFNTKHPMLLPKSHPVTDLIIVHYHKVSLHAGTAVVLSLIRQKFWFPSGRDKVRQMLRKCVICQKLNARTSHQIMAQLPKDCISPSRPFEKVGVDFAGPVTTKPNLPRTKVKLKSYIALFICFATRAIHLELVSELSTDAFLACFNRFISRRGLPSDVYSDNGTNFRGADNHLKSVLSVMKSDTVQSYASDKLIHWHFSPPGGPHFGGLWEANIKSTKTHVFKICNSAVLNFEEFATLLTQVEACLNSRPIAPLNSDPNDLEPLTPGHFLIGAPLLSLPEIAPSHAMTLKSRWALVQSLRNQFWVRWTRDYLHHLQLKSKWTSPATNVQVGELVLLRTDISAHPLKWNLARVLEVFPGPDGVVRVVTVKTANGILKRPITKLCRMSLD